MIQRKLLRDVPSGIGWFCGFICITTERENKKVYLKSLASVKVNPSFCIIKIDIFRYCG